jgi:hypothetical protein
MDDNASVPRTNALLEPSEPQVARLASLISSYCPHDGHFKLSIPGVYVVRHSRVTTETQLLHQIKE